MLANMRVLNQIYSFRPDKPARSDSESSSFPVEGFGESRQKFLFQGRSSNETASFRLEAGDDAFRNIDATPMSDLKFFQNSSPFLLAPQRSDDRLHVEGGEGEGA